MDNNGVPFSGLDNNTFYNNVKIALNKVFGDVKLETGRFTSLGGLLENDWRKDKNGENYRKRINQSNRRDAIEQLVNTLNGEISQINEAFAEKYGWDKAKKPKEKPEVTPEVSYQLDKPQKVKVKKDKSKGIGKPGVSYQLRDARDEYGISHRPSSEGPPAHDLFKGDMVPDDVYDIPRYYIGSLPKDKVYKETVDAIRYLKSIKGNPEAEVTVYRAGPKRELNKGDWITLSKTYAEGHADSWNTFEGENYKLHEFKVKAKDVLWDMNSLEEWGYYPKEKPEVSYQLTPKQEEFFKDAYEKRTVYHGTKKDEDIEEFRVGTWVTPEPLLSEKFVGYGSWAGRQLPGGSIFPLRINIKKPLDIRPLLRERGSMFSDISVKDFVREIEKAVGEKMPKKLIDEIKQLTEPIYDDYLNDETGEEIYDGVIRSFGV